MDSIISEKKRLYQTLLSFPPFFTLQQHQQSKKKQLIYWAEIIHQQCRQKNIINTSISQLCNLPVCCDHSQTIPKKLSKQDMFEIAKQLEKLGCLDFQGGQKILVSHFNPYQMADDLYRWAKEHHLIGDVQTFKYVSSGQFTTPKESIIFIHFRVLQTTNRDFSQSRRHFRKSRKSSKDGHWFRFWCKVSLIMYIKQFHKKFDSFSAYMLKEDRKQRKLEKCLLILSLSGKICFAYGDKIFEQNHLKSMGKNFFDYLTPCSYATLIQNNFSGEIMPQGVDHKSFQYYIYKRNLQNDMSQEIYQKKKILAQCTRIYVSFVKGMIKPLQIPIEIYSPHKKYKSDIQEMILIENTEIRQEVQTKLIKFQPQQFIILERQQFLKHSFKNTKYHGNISKKKKLNPDLVVSYTKELHSSNNQSGQKYNLKQQDVFHSSD